MPCYKSGSEIRKLIEEIHKAQAWAEPVAMSLRLTITLEKLRALTNPSYSPQMRI
jgi:hypothetical protein